MDFTVLIVGLFIGVGIPLRNKVIKEYRKKRNKNNNPLEQMGENVEK